MVAKVKRGGDAAEGIEGRPGMVNGTGSGERRRNRRKGREYGENTHAAPHEA